MQEVIEVYKTKITLPKQPPIEEIDGYDLPTEEQMWRRVELPEFMLEVKMDKNGDLDLNDEQWEFANREVQRCKHGFWFMNNGVPTYITGKNYFYLTWWKLEDDIYPDYRDTDRRYYLFLDYWENITWCLGVCRGKKRREGASSQATANLVYEVIFYKNSNCGLISKTKDDSKDTFTDMVGFGYRQLPAFLKPRQLNKEDSVTEFVFAYKSTTVKQGLSSVIQEDKGHRSKINFRAPVLNAYDRGRISRILLDEFGKLEKDVPASQLFSIVAKTLVKGAKRVGFAEMPSTVNKLTKGGSEYKLIWENANQFKKRPTTNRLVRYFTPAYDGYEGFIDKYGMSVIGEPTHEQYQYLVDKWVQKDPYTEETTSELSEEDIRLGAEAYIKKRRADLTGDLLEEEIRMNPCNEDELFMAANIGCVFNSFKLNKQLKRLEENPVFARPTVYYRKMDGTVDKRGKEDSDEIWWEQVDILERIASNKYAYELGIRKPVNGDAGVISVDGYSNEQGGRKYGSKACAFIYLKYDISDPVNTGLFAGWLYGRPSRKELLHEQVLLCAEYNSFPIYYECVADDYLSYFRQRGRVGYLGKFPMSAIDPDKRGKEQRYYGFPITPFAMTKQMDAMIAYIEDFCDKIYWDRFLQQCLEFDPNNRTKSDCVVSAMIALVSSLDVARPPRVKVSLVKQYANPLHHTNGGGEHEYV